MPARANTSLSQRLKAMLESPLPFTGGPSTADLLLFTKHMSVMLKSGILINEALSILVDQTKKAGFRTALRQIQNDVMNGQAFTTALSQYPRYFSAFYINLVRVGEQSGNLVQTLEYLAIQIRKSYEFKQKIQGALLYPGIIFATALISGSGMAFFVLPRLVDIFESLDVDLPLSTRLLLGFAAVMKNHGTIIGIGLVASIVAFLLLIQQRMIKKIWQRFLLSLPILGPFLQHIQLATLCRNFGIMLKSGIPISEALSTLALSTDNLIYQEYVVAMAQGVQKGNSLEEILDRKKFRLIPLLATRMIGVGEKSGKLDESLMYLSDFFEDDVQHTAENFAAIIEPVVLLGVGLLVGFVAISIVSPIYQLTGSIQR